MQSIGNGSSFLYWKRPWQKWVVFVAGLLQLVALLLNIQEYRDMAETGILSSSVWESYAIQQSFQCAITGLSAALFLGIFLIGVLARCGKAARLAEGIFLLVLAFAWAIVGFVFQLPSQGGLKIMFSWSLLLLILLGGSAFTFWKRQNG